MAQRADRDAPAEIEIAFAGNVIHVTSRTVTHHEIEAPVAGNDVLVEEGLNGRHVIAHYGWWRWNNFFHALHVIRITLYLVSGQIRCLWRNWKLPTPLMVCGPLKNSMAVRSWIPKSS